MIVPLSVGLGGAAVLGGGAVAVSAERGERAATFVDSLRVAHQLPANSAAVAILSNVNFAPIGEVEARRVLELILQTEL
jgi:hypothetical protein